MITVFDLDNCLFDDAHRRPLLPTPAKLRRCKERGDAVQELFTLYHSAHAEDSVLDSAKDLVTSALESSSWVVFLTSRHEEFRSSTWDQLCRVFGLSDDAAGAVLLMRGPNEDRPSAQYKPEALTKLLKRGDEAKKLVIYDDRVEVLRAFKESLPHATLMLMSPTIAPINVTDSCWDVDDHGIPFECQGEAVGSCAVRDAERPGLPVPQLLRSAAETYEARNAVYADNYKAVAPMIRSLFPNGVPPDLVVDDRWHLFELLLVKITRYARTRFTHEDSMRDASVYCAMLEALAAEEHDDEGK